MRHLGVLCALATTACSTPLRLPDGSATPTANSTSLRAFPASVVVRPGGDARIGFWWFDGAERLFGAPVAAVAPISDQPAIAVVNEKGSVHGTTVGKTILRGQHSLSGVASTVQIPVTVTDAKVQSLVIEARVGRLGVAGEIHALATFEDGTTGDVTEDATWTIDPAAFRWIENTTFRNVVIPIRAGQSAIAVQYEGLLTYQSVSVSATLPVSIALRPAFTWHEIRRFGAFATYADGTTAEISGACAWTWLRAGKTPVSFTYPGATLPLLGVVPVPGEAAGSAACAFRGLTASSTLATP